MAHDTCTRVVDTIRHTLGAIRASIRGLASTANDGTSSAALDALKMAVASTIDEIGELPAQFDLVDLSCLSGILDDISQKVRATAQSVCDTLKETLHDELQSVIDSAEGALGLEDIEDEASFGGSGESFLDQFYAFNAQLPERIAVMTGGVVSS